MRRAPERADGALGLAGMCGNRDVGNLGVLGCSLKILAFDGAIDQKSKLVYGMDVELGEPSHSS